MSFATIHSMIRFFHKLAENDPFEGSNPIAFWVELSILLIAMVTLFLKDDENIASTYIRKNKVFVLVILGTVSAIVLISKICLYE